MTPQKFDKFGNTKQNEATVLVATSGAASGGSHQPNYGGNSARGSSGSSGGTSSADVMTVRSLGAGGGGGGGGGGHHKSQSKYANSRKLIAELYDNETPRLCDHSLLEESDENGGNSGGIGGNGNRMRPCSPLESYVSASRDMVSFDDMVFIVCDVHIFVYDVMCK